MLKYSNEQIIEGLVNNNSDVIKDIYHKCYKSIESLLLKHGCNSQEACDVFHDGIYIIYLKIQKNELNLTCPFKNYLTIICIRLWFKEYKRKSKHTNIEDFHFLNDNHEHINHDIEIKKIQLFRYHYNKLSAKCREILKLHFHNVENFRISKKLKHNSVQHTANRKTRCQASLRNRIYNDPEFLILKDYD